VRLFKPREVLARVTDATPAWFSERGLEAAILDLDNTLIPYGYEGEPPETLTRWLASLKEAGIPAILLTNAKPGRTRRWAKKLGIPGLGPAAKPLPFGFLWAAGRLGTPHLRVAVFGDQVFTDVLGGNLLGFYTVYVVPLSDRGLPHTRFVRRLERHFLPGKEA